MSKLKFYITDICVGGDMFFNNISGNKLILKGNPVSDMDIFTQLTFGLPVFFLLIIFGIWFVFGRDEKVIGPLDAYPTKCFNSAETGFLYNGKADAEDVVSLLIYLANRGYIKITETCEKALKQPGWYSGSGSFNYVSFRNFIISFMQSAIAAMDSTPSNMEGRTKDSLSKKENQSMVARMKSGIRIFKY